MITAVVFTLALRDFLITHMETECLVADYHRLVIGNRSNCASVAIFEN